MHNECEFERFVSALEAERSIVLQGLHVDKTFNGKWKNIADAGTFDPRTLGRKHKKVFGHKITIRVRDGARAWLKERGVIPPLGHDSSTWSIPSELIDEFNKLFVISVSK